jgi:pilus assembly protein Flp/PilA
MCNLVKRLMTDESGVSATEYAILLAVVGAGVVAATVVFGKGLNTMFVNLTGLMTGWVT